MSDQLNGRPPASYYIIAGVFLVWNIIGLLFYYQQMTLTPEAIASMGPEIAAFMEATPVWANAGYAIAVNAGVVASILLLLRNSWALYLYVLSFLGVLIQDLDAFVLRDVAGVFGNFAYYLPSIVIIICIAEIWYTRSVANRYQR
ncbi:MAG: hypothetical protein OEW73_01120 [Gammaproteobacteria bacterium]|nr:hypothetical protein [Gammaproteobacteria bacterium]MDH5239363.1 hypothetical protein [Gammaproteobacteria bacterium]MDH5259792.1 hypothetical protein [Gammaproteobacteria bacterium]MDH5582865.1 hypothetical protein [Gammaproteobacteria bacterium]